MNEFITSLDPSIQLIIFMASLSLIPFAFVSLTSFVRFAIVFSILKQAMGTQQVPPSMIIIGLAMILTLHTMSPVFQEMYEAGYEPYKKNGSIVLALTEASIPLKKFMMRQTRQKDIAFFIEVKKQEPPKTPEDISFFDLAPAYMIGELKTAFEIGFIIFIPFIVIDIIVANVLLALGMMMLSPTIISLPFKLLIFIAVDGWSLIVKGLVQSFN